MSKVIRYVVKYGSFSRAIIYDQLESMELSIEQVCDRLNLFEKIKNRGYI